MNNQYDKYISFIRNQYDKILINMLSKSFCDDSIEIRLSIAEKINIITLCMRLSVIGLYFTHWNNLPKKIKVYMQSKSFIHGANICLISDKRC